MTQTEEQVISDSKVAAVDMKLEVVVIPPNLPMVRKDGADLVYKNERGKFRAGKEQRVEENDHRDGGTRNRERKQEPFSALTVDSDGGGEKGYRCQGKIFTESDHGEGDHAGELKRGVSVSHRRRGAKY